MNFRKLLCALTLAMTVSMMAAASAFSQQKTVRGTVTDESGEPVMGVAVIIKNTTEATMTGYDGKYAISVEKGETLQFSFLGMAPREITVADIRAWQNELLSYKDKNGKGYAPTYLKTINCQLTAIFNYAIRYYNLPGNPCKKAGAIGKSKGEPKDFWMQDEFNEFLKTVEDKPDARLAFLVLYWTGMRIGELLALTYYDVNLEEKTISINKSYQRLKGKDVITQPKTPKSIRVITMPDFLVEEFREYYSHLYGIMKKDRLFHFTKSYMEHNLISGIKKSGVKRIRLHDLRHSHASMLVDMGIPQIIVLMIRWYPLCGFQNLFLSFRYSLGE